MMQGQLKQTTIIIKYTDSATSARELVGLGCLLKITSPPADSCVQAVLNSGGGGGGGGGWSKLRT